MQNYIIEHIRRQQATRQHHVNLFRDLFLIKQLTSTSYVESLKNEAADKVTPRPSLFAQILVSRILQSDNNGQQRSEWLLKLPKLVPEPQADFTFG
jgi:recombinational DNA repair protein (RecF pathway)